MYLSKNNLHNILASADLIIPGEEVFSFPEKVLQFGTGKLLRALPDYFIDKANRRGIFKGRIVMVKSTSHGDIESFVAQDNLYIVCVRGIENKKKREEFIVNSSVSRVLSAKENWISVLDCAYNPELRIIISNTTELGIVLTNDNIRLSPPSSFPGKLLSFLFERYNAFSGSDESGMIIIPTELIPDNGTKLRSIILHLAEINELDDRFIKWLTTANYFCNSLVDRIVPGSLAKDVVSEIENRLGYSDRLMIITESFCLWAIESDDKNVREVLSFEKADDGLVIVPDIEKFRELKLRLLNGTHSFTCGLALLAGFKTVREAMGNSQFLSFIKHISLNEISAAVSDSKISFEECCDFAQRTLDRFQNPFIDHYWKDIAVQYSAKMKERCVPLIIKYYNKYSYPPVYFALSFAGFLLFVKCYKNENGNFVGEISGSEYQVQDDHATYFATQWNKNSIDGLVDKILGDTEFWGTNLSMLNGFAEAVKKNLYLLSREGSIMAIKQLEK